MTRTLHLGRLAICYFALALPAAAQLDSASLHAKFGSPLDRETYHMPAGFDLVVDYGSNHQVCKLQVPALMPTDEKVSNSDVMKARMYAFLSELIPNSMRGKELGRFMNAMGIQSFLTIDYEHITVGESQDGSNSFAGTITVSFKTEGCQKPAVP
jgi:hypothetical protein